MLIIEQELNVTRVCECFQLHRKEILLKEETTLCPHHQIPFYHSTFCSLPADWLPDPLEEESVTRHGN